jgi:hypothetical protein
MSIEQKDIERLFALPEEELPARLYNPGRSIAEWVAVSAVIEQRRREKALTDMKNFTPSTTNSGFRD